MQCIYCLNPVLAQDASEVQGSNGSLSVMRKALLVALVISALAVWPCWSTGVVLEIGFAWLSASVKVLKCFRIFQVVVGDVDTIVFCCSDLVDSISNSDGQWLSSRTQGSKSLIVVDAVVPVCSVVAVYFNKSCRYIEIKFNQCFVECFAMVILFREKQLGPTR